jgi:hypothetical protein
MRNIVKPKTIGHRLRNFLAIDLDFNEEIEPIFWAFKLKSELNSSLISMNDLTNFVGIDAIDNDSSLTDDQ